MSEEIFASRDAHVISLAASVAAGCLPCAGYYIERARQAGVADEELRAAIALASSVRTRAADDCATRARRRLGDALDQPAPLPLPLCERDILLSIAAAYVVNSHALVTQLFESARALQVPPDKLFETIQIARGVRNMAVAIVDRRVQLEGGPAGADTGQTMSCTCG